MEIFSIASGSSGNCIVVGDDDHHVLIDSGISGKKIEQGLNKYDLCARDIDAILVTHEHWDHISGLGVMARRYGLPIYGTKGTINAIRRYSGLTKYKALGNIDDSLFNCIERDVDFSIGNLDIHPIHISHDAADPVGYRLSNNGKSVAVVTDLGTYDDYTIDNMKDLDVLFVEANHDINMLEVGHYPYPLKQRILSDSGHLSNAASGDLLGKVLNDHVKHIFLGHLSAENNIPELAYETVRQEVTLGDNPYKADDFPITVALRHEVSEMVTA